MGKVNLVLVFFFILYVLIFGIKISDGKYYLKINSGNNIIAIVKKDKIFLEKIIESGSYSSLLSRDIMSIYNDIELVENELVVLRNDLKDINLISQISEAIVSCQSAKIILARLKDIITSKSRSKIYIYREIISLEENIYEIEIYLRGINLKFDWLGIKAKKL